MNVLWARADVLKYIWADYERTMSRRPMPHTNNENVHLRWITKTNKRTREEEHENIRKRYNKYKIRRWDNKKIIAKRKEKEKQKQFMSGLWADYERIMSGWIPKEDRHVDVEGIHKRKGEGKISKLCADYEQIMSGLWASCPGYKKTIRMSILD